MARVTERLHLAMRPDTTADTLTALSTDTNSNVRWFVATNPNTPPDTLTILAGDINECVRRNVADNPNTPTGAIHSLATDPDSYVADAAATSGRINCLHRYANTVPEPARTHAWLLIDSEFLGWPAGLSTILNSQHSSNTTAKPCRFASRREFSTEEEARPPISRHCHHS